MRHLLAERVRFTPRLPHPIAPRDESRAADDFMDARLLLRTSRLLLLAAALLMLTGCVRERTIGDSLVVHFRWWSLLWGFVIPICFFVLVVAKHPSTWINGRWRPWWKFTGWDAKELGYALGALVILPISMCYVFDRVEVTSKYFQERSASPFRGTRRVEFSEIDHIELPPEESGQSFWPGPKQKERDRVRDLVVVLRDRRRESFDGQLIRNAKPAILERARQAGVQTLPPGMTSNASMAPPAGFAPANPFEHRAPIFGPSARPPRPEPRSDPAQANGKGP